MFDPSIATLDCAGKQLLLDRPRIMGVVNVTPDSFSDGGHHADAEAAIAHGLRLVEEGADILDVGGESTRPGAGEVPVEDELARVLPVIDGLSRASDCIISIDSSKPEVIRAACAAGAGMINDVFALRRDGAIDAAAGTRAAICLMHMQGEPRSMQEAPDYDDVVGDVHRFLAERIFACEMAGIDKRRLLVDPGFGFGKSLEHNLLLLRQLERLLDLGRPVLAGLSRKSMIGTLTGRPVDERLHGSIAAAVIAVTNGASVVRVHDVAATRDALSVWHAVAGQPAPAQRSAGKSAGIAWPDDD